MDGLWWLGRKEYFTWPYFSSLEPAPCSSPLSARTWQCTCLLPSLCLQCCSSPLSWPCCSEPASVTQGCCHVPCRRRPTSLRWRSKRPMGTSWPDSGLHPASRMCKLTTRSSSWSTATPARSSDPLVLPIAASATTAWTGLTIIVPGSETA